MIDVIVDKERNLKNLKQIGTPQEENKIYVENLAYSKLKEDSYREKRVFVLMGHTERMEGRYATFIEAVIPVNDMEFSGGIPRWNNKIWSGVFREIKRIYEDMIIVGWVLDAKGLSLKMTHELERVHREYFGGIHQLLFLMDTIEKEEAFYTYKESRLRSQEGFYIYYHSKPAGKFEKEQQPEEVILNLEISGKQLEELSGKKLQKNPEPVNEQTKGGQYRALLKNQQGKDASTGSNAGIAVAVALLMFVIGVGTYENKDRIFGNSNIPSAEETGFTLTEETETSVSEMTETENVSEVMGEGVKEEGTIPVEIIPGETEKSSE